jgi:hydrogenase small subunit
MVKEIPVVWLAASACTGCSVSLLNAASPRINNVLLDEIIPGVHVNLRFHQTIMAGAGSPAIDVLEATAAEKPNGYILAVDGAIPSADGAVYCAMGERDGKPVHMETRFCELAEKSLAILAVGTCAAFGGIPAAAPNPTGCRPLTAVLKEKGIDKPVVNVPGCPPNPDWVIGTIGSILLNGLPGPSDLDEHLRPLAFYGQLIHENCPRRAYFDEGKFAKKPGDQGCLYELGCKGPITYADCPTRRWHAGTNWVIGAGAPCNGCTQPEFPDLTSPFYEKLTDVAMPNIGTYWTAGKEAE